MSDLRFDGRVVVVTGAGGGLGREYALLFAERGADVVVNDLGGSASGDGGGDVRPADLVVEEIRARGGSAVANHDSVEDGERIVRAAEAAFGRVDVVVNNAGILRDRSFARTSDADWDGVQRVHARGAFAVTRAAWPGMRARGYGRVVVTSSAAGLFGNFGQANYAAAKMALVGLSNTLAIEGAAYGICCNAVVPTAGSRLTRGVFPGELVDALKPEYVAPLVAYLCHESCEETGGVFEAGAGWIGKLRWERSQGRIVREKGKRMTPEAVRDSWEGITDMTSASHPSSIQESTATLVDVLEKINEGHTTSPGNAGDPSASGIAVATTTVEAAVSDVTVATATDDAAASDAAVATATDDAAAAVAKLRDAAIEPSVIRYTDRDVILYHLGIGCSVADAGSLKFLYEGSDDFSVVPTFSTTCCDLVAAFGAVGSAIEFDLSRFLHGEQYTEVYGALPTDATLITTYRIADVLDKTSGAAIVIVMETRDERGRKVALNQAVGFLIGAGGFGGPRTSREQVPTVAPPTGPPHDVVVERTSVDQAALYRLSGDRNPLHVDAAFAAAGGFARPILHGLCAYGYACRHVLRRYAGGDVARFRTMKARFARPVLPGQTLRTEMWRRGERVHLRCVVDETGEAALTGAYVDLVADDPGSGPTAKL
ncbi:PREDICTED: peroxisomal multifunctional enzyme type 2-like [Priapulus caudatus]|uniref:Peroxisomal multifunctional enzyme type 2-like n=1 Tax=Priapulus caudatus TaxID=37621 RepID=A0ABM1E254_PRICU|nr:PREDICTED: peroxisomal multifunctional enzyme type 2-like [Priapulus caudatus]